MFGWLKRIIEGPKKKYPYEFVEDGYRVIVHDEFRSSRFRIPEPPPAHRTPEFEEMSSREKIKLVKIQPLPFKDGERLSTGSKAGKVFHIRIEKQKPDVFEFDEEGAITVLVVARGRQAAFDLLAEKICKRGAFFDQNKSKEASCGRWYDGNIVNMTIVKEEKSEPA